MVFVVGLMFQVTSPLASLFIALHHNITLPTQEGAPPSITDPVYYTSTPAMSYDSALKFTKSEFELLDDVDKVMFTDGAMVGGYAGAVCRPLQTARTETDLLGQARSPTTVVGTLPH